MTEQKGETIRLSQHLESVRSTKPPKRSAAEVQAQAEEIGRNFDTNNTLTSETATGASRNRTDSASDGKTLDEEESIHPSPSPSSRDSLPRTIYSFEDIVSTPTPTPPLPPVTAAATALTAPIAAQATRTEVTAEKLRQQMSCNFVYLAEPAESLKLEHEGTHKIVYRDESYIHDMHRYEFDNLMKDDPSIGSSLLPLPQPLASSYDGVQ
jgi:hypothetical protein